MPNHNIPTPVTGLTYRKGRRESNIHAVEDGIVFYAVYYVGEKHPVGTYQATIDEWQRMAEQAIQHGAEVFSLLRS